MMEKEKQREQLKTVIHVTIINDIQEIALLPVRLHYTVIKHPVCKNINNPV